jgi:hypothetical protein
MDSESGTGAWLLETGAAPLVEQATWSRIEWVWVMAGSKKVVGSENCTTN